MIILLRKIRKVTYATYWLANNEQSFWYIYIYGESGKGGGSGTIHLNMTVVYKRNLQKYLIQAIAKVRIFITN